MNDVITKQYRLNLPVARICVHVASKVVVSLRQQPRGLTEEVARMHILLVRV